MSKYSGTSKSFGTSKSLRSKNKYNDEEDDEIIQNQSIMSRSKKSKFDNIDQISDIDQVGGENSDLELEHISKLQDDIQNQSQRKYN